MAYDFSTLNDKEFEKLARDILNKKFDLDLQDFKYGQDLGVDLRYSSPKNINSIVVQAKHYVKSGYKKLLSELKNKELPKVNSLKPDRYIIVTSLPLSNKYKNEIFVVFQPYIQSPNDIFGCEDLNKYIEADSELERKWYKLWLSSLNVLNTVLHNAVLGRSAFAESKIKKTIQLYCHSQSYDDAFEILSKHKYILITGQPGVGKTTLANFLTYYLLSQDHQLIYIDSDVKDAEELFVNDPLTKQVFYFDDFLGANYLEIINPRTSESSFVNFLERIKNTDGKYLILTTRTTIFRTALDRYEKMKRIKVDIARKEIELGKYSELDKARILYNHLYHSNMDEEHKQEILSGKKYWDIIIHRNYNPRLIEFITNANNSIDVPKGKFMEFVSRNLENPEEVWRHAYEQQLSAEEVILLHIIYSQKQNTQIDDTRLLFDNMLQYEVASFNHRPTINPFINACKKLLDGILKKEVTISSKLELINFINPSINDFLNNYFLANNEARWKLIRGSKNIEQFEQYKQYFFNYSDSKLNFLRDEISLFAEHVLIIFDQIQCYSNNEPQKDEKKYIQLRTCSLLNSLMIFLENISIKIANTSYETIKNFDVSNLDNESRGLYIEVIKSAIIDSPLEKFVLDNWDNIIYFLFLTSEDESDYDEILQVFSEFSVDFEKFIRSSALANQIKTFLKNYIESTTESWIDDDKDAIYSANDWETVKGEIKSKRADFLYKFYITDDFYNEAGYFKDENLGELIERNLTTKERNTNQLVNKQSNNDDQDLNLEKDIEELFVGKYVPEELNKIVTRNLPF